MRIFFSLFGLVLAGLLFGHASWAADQVINDELSLWHSPANSGVAYSDYEPSRVRRDGGQYFHRTHRSLAGTGIRFGEVRLTSDNGGVIYLPRGISLDGASALSLLVRKSSKKARWTLSVMKSANQVAVIEEGDRAVQETAQGTWRRLVIPLNMLRFREVPLTPVDKNDSQDPRKLMSRYQPRVASPLFGIRFGLVGGKSGDSLFFDNLVLVTGLPDSAGKISGVMRPAVPGAKVNVTTDKGARTVQIGTNGNFSLTLPEGAKIGEIIAVAGNRVITPQQGRFIEFGSHIPQVSFDARPEGTQEHFKNMPLKGNINDSVYLIDKEYGSHLEPMRNFTVGVEEFKKQEVLAEATTNEFGFIDRDRLTRNLDQAYRVVVLGECHHMGVHIAQSDAWWNQAEALLTINVTRQVEMVSASYHYSPFVNAWPAFRHLNRKLKPDLVILPFIHPEVLNLNIDEYVMEWLSAAKDHLPAYQFDVSKSGKVIHRPMDTEWQLYRVTRTPEERRAIREKYDTWQYARVDKANRPEWVKRNLLAIEGALREYASEGQKNGIKVAVFYISDFHLQASRVEKGIQMDPGGFRREFEELVKRSGVEFVDLSAQIFGTQPLNNRGQYFYPANGHLTAYGHYKLGTALADYLIPLLRVNSPGSAAKREAPNNN